MLVIRSFSRYKEFYMIKISIVCVGKIKEKYWNMAIEEFTKRLSRYASLSIIEVADEKTPDNASDAENEQIKNTEGKRILAKIPENSYVTALAIEGKQMSSTGLAEWIDKKSVSGVGHLTFIIGGSLGLSKEVMNRADHYLSFSMMTFPHQMMRVVLLEQIYRAFRINSNEPYHK